MSLTDGDHVRNLLGHYCDLMDAGQFGEVGGLFASARLLDGEGHVLATGASEVAAMYEAMVRRYDDGTPRTKHLVLNTVLDDDGDGTMIARSSYVVFQATGELALQPIITGRYVDRFTRDGESAWRFTERTFLVDQAGDLSHHLLGGLP